MPVARLTAGAPGVVVPGVPSAWVPGPSPPSSSTDAGRSLLTTAVGSDPSRVTRTVTAPIRVSTPPTTDSQIPVRRILGDSRRETGCRGVVVTAGAPISLGLSAPNPSGLRTFTKKVYEPSRRGRIRGSARGRRYPRTTDVPPLAHPEGLQVLRRADHPRVRTGAHGRRRPERQREVERGRRGGVGAGGPGSPQRPVVQDGRRHLRRHRPPAGPRPGRGQPHHRQHPGRAAHRLPRGHDHPHAVPDLGRERVHPQRGALPAARPPGTALRHRRRPPAAHHRVPGQPRRGPRLPPRGPPAHRRGGGRHPQVPAPQGEGRAPAGGDRGQPGAPHRPPAGGGPPAASPRAPGRRRPPPRRPGGRAATACGSSCGAGSWPSSPPATTRRCWPVPGLWSTRPPSRPSSTRSTSR